MSRFKQAETIGFKNKGESYFIEESTKVLYCKTYVGPYLPCITKPDTIKDPTYKQPYIIDPEAPIFCKCERSTFSLIKAVNHTFTSYCTGCNESMVLR